MVAKKETMLGIYSAEDLWIPSVDLNLRGRPLWLYGAGSSSEPVKLSMNGAEGTGYYFCRYDGNIRVSSDRYYFYWLIGDVRP